MPLAVLRTMQLYSKTAAVVFRINNVKRNFECSIKLCKIFQGLTQQHSPWKWQLECLPKHRRTLKNSTRHILGSRSSTTKEQLKPLKLTHESKCTAKNINPVYSYISRTEVIVSFLMLCPVAFTSDQSVYRINFIWFAMDKTTGTIRFSLCIAA
jgi:hypothetical protein